MTISHKFRFEFGSNFFVKDYITKRWKINGLGLIPSIESRVPKFYFDIGVKWYIGMPSACYSADPDSNPGKGDREMARQMDRFLFRFSSETFRLVRICRVANDAAKISQTAKNIHK